MKKSTFTGLIVFVIVFIVVIIGYFIYTNLSKTQYSCIDPKTNTFYSFNTEEEMHEVCDLFSSDVDIEKTDYKNIYNELINTNDDAFIFYPYLNSDNKLSIIVASVECNNSSVVQSRVKNWFVNHSYNIDDYEIEYEYSCE